MPRLMTTDEDKPLPVSNDIGVFSTLCFIGAITVIVRLSPAY